MRSRSLSRAAVSVIGYGGMHLSISDRPSEEQGVRVIHAGLDAGITLIDTADAYCLDASDTGHNERLIARALREWGGRKDTITVATKGGIVRTGGSWIRNGRPDHLRRACDASLTALGVDQIALYQFHAPDPQVPFAESVGAFAELRQAGKVRDVGLSNVSVAQIEEARGIVPIAAVQNRLNPFFREARTDGVLDYCSAEGIAFLAYSPVGGGRLNKKLRDVRIIYSLADYYGRSPHAVVLAWVLAQGPTVIAIPSARSVDNVEDSAESADLQLTPADVEAIDKAEFDRS